VSAPEVDFFFGIGSRYSYLAATQIDRLAAETGARVNWFPVSSATLMERRGQNPFAGPPPSGQYDWGFRRRDAEAWADYYGVPFRDPIGRIELDGSLYARACVAAGRMGALESYSMALFGAVFVDDLNRVDREQCIARAAPVGLEREAFAHCLDDDATAALVESILRRALDAGVFGVPTFIVNGALFWGNDRLVLVRHALRRYQGMVAPS
jgi:2-hydroxychromene-2-carboxylate isomerase